jgi:hypothetical protein
MKNLCTVCSSEGLVVSLNLGSQPCSNRFGSSHESAISEPAFPVSFGYCEECGTYQLIDRMPIEAIRPDVDWLIYNEPEGHLDETVKLLINDLHVQVDWKILGLTYKDQSTIDRLKVSGCKNAECLDESIFEIENRPYGLESIQQSISNPLAIDRIIAKKGLVDLLVVRHIIEHASSAMIFLKLLSKILTKNGVVVLEIPDSEKFLAKGNYPFIWEEHVSYFTEQSIAKLVEFSGGHIVSIQRYSYPFEDSLIVAIQFNASEQKSSINEEVAVVEEKNYLFENIEQDFKIKKSDIYNKLSKIKGEGGKIALFGAGHLAVKTLNYYGINNLVEFVVDDHPNKVGKYMPGSGLKIMPTSSLMEKNITFCLSTLSPESEIKVRSKFKDYFASGANLNSIFSPG